MGYMCASSAARHRPPSRLAWTQKSQGAAQLSARALSLLARAHNARVLVAAARGNMAEVETGSRRPDGTLRPAVRPATTHLALWPACAKRLRCSFMPCR